MHNDFIVVGPKDDPAKTKDLASTDDVLQPLVTQSPFLSHVEMIREPTKQN
jgi:ABC-type tungstate transport system permease subunit